MYYPFDTSGVLPSNKILNEVHTIASVNGVDHNYFVPLDAPFYNSSLVIVENATGRFLDEGTDFEFGHRFQQAVDELGVEVSGSVVLLDKNITGSFTLAYQTLGGDYVTAATRAINDGLSALLTAQTTLWDDIVSLPTTFPPTPHTHTVTDIDAVQEIIDEMGRIRQAIEGSFSDIELEDIRNLDTAFVTPLFTKLGDIADAITAQAAVTSLYSEQAALGISPTNLGAQVDGVWFDTPLLVTPRITGTFEVMWNIDHRTNLPAGSYTVETRFLYDGSIIPKSYNNGAILGMYKDKDVKVQMRVLGGSPTEFWLANNTPAASHSSSLTIKRLSN